MVCPAGSECFDHYSTPSPCSETYYSLGGNSTCTICPAGYRCPTTDAEPIICQAGQYAGLGQTSCQDCPKGSYCPYDGSSAPTVCSAGWYADSLGNANCTECPIGYQCADETKAPQACPTGYYTDQTGQETCITFSTSGSTSCAACPVGQACGSSGQGLCQVGEYSNGTDCLPCPQGFMCPSPLGNPQACPSGTYQDTTGKSICNLCPGGSSCLSVSGSPTACDPGYYSLSGQQVCSVCPEGQWSEEGVSSCSICPAGQECLDGSDRIQPRNCTAGTYAAQGGGICTPCPLGMYSLEQASSCTPCPTGSLCLVASDLPTACPTGTYSGLGEGTLCTDCPAGFYCPDPVNVPQPCPYGTYSSARNDSCTPCPEGMSCLDPADAPVACDSEYYSPEMVPRCLLYPANCPLGTYHNSSRSTSADDCIACDPGYYCAGDNNPEPTGPCNPGYYCTGGSGTSIQHEVPEGHYSGSAAYKAEPCEPGTYTTATASSSCLDCPQGAYCNDSGTATPQPCLSGHYCPPRTIVPIPCPVGTYRVEPNAQDVGDCPSCPPGKYCGETGLSTWSGDCAAGHYCIGGADNSHPYVTECANSTILGGGECPAGYYCPEGTKTPISHPCQNGTFLNVTGGQEMADCLDCPGGEVCGGYALTEPNELCAPGYFCIGKAKTKYPTDGDTGNICPVGHYCPEGSPAAIRCQDGEYNNLTGRAECFTPPPGFYCADSERLLECPRGHYCPEGTGSNGSIPCPRGTYNPDLGLASVDQCQPCAPGYYCTQLGAYSFGIANGSAGPCDPGYYCQSGVNISNPDGETNSGIGGPCPQGFFCPQQTSVPQPCPNGTYSDALYLSEESQCEACDPGFYCGTYNLTGPQAPCDPGFYCHYGSSYPNPIGDDITGAPCPVGTYCKAGSSKPIGCPPGTYNENTQQSECHSCPRGWYCPGNVSNFRPFDCPAGYYCPDGTEHAYQYPCPKGTYRPNENGQALSDCTICDPGKYCAYEGNTTVTGDCDEGFFCIQGAWTAQPMDFDNYTDGDCLCPSLSTGGRCQPGYYCPRGSIEPEKCTEGNYCDVEGLADVAGKCMEGFYCISTAVRPDPTDGITGDICPRGRYCGNGTGANPPMCPSGTYSNSTGLMIEDQCTYCTAGSYCEDPGLTQPTGLCDPGYYCPTGQSSSSLFPCGQGYYCEEGSASETACVSGTYQDDIGQSSCKLCNGGYYCDVADAPISDYTIYPCPVGHFCPNGTEFDTQYPCPAGTYNPSERLEREDQCLDCPPGKFCDTPGEDNWMGDCAAGYWCIGASSSATPNNDVTGVECPAGKYCIEGTPAPENCPVGTWSDSLGLEKASDCYPCSGGFYCNGNGLTAPSGPCDPGYYCSTNASMATPEDGGITGDPCTTGHYCPGQTTSPLPCEPGTYTTTTHRSECDTCPAGFFCTTGYEPEECPHCFYCPAGTGYDWQPCPTGSFSNMAGLANETQCTLCSPGKFCSELNATMVTADCEAGYLCTEGSDRARPKVTFKAICQNISWISPRFEEVRFPVGKNGTWANSTGTCPFNTTQANQPIGRALCIGDGITQSQWQPVDNCGPFRNVTDVLTEIAQVIVGEENAGEVSQQVSSVTSNIEDITSDDITSLAEITSNIVQQNLTSEEVTESITSIVSNIAQVETEQLEAAEEEGGAISQLVLAFEEQISRVEVADGGMLNIQQPNVAVQVQSVLADDVMSGLVLTLAGPSLSDLSKSNITISAPTKDDRDDVIATRPGIIAQVNIPPSVSSIILSTAPLSGSPSNDSGEYVRVNFNVFSTPALFISKSLRTFSADNEGFNRSANSPVISLSIGQGKVAALTEFINFTFTTIMSGYVNPMCSFWDEEQEDWSQDGCVLVSGITSSDERYDEEGVCCACDHLTNFAVIMDIHRPDDSPIEAYNILTYIGCCISIFSLLVTLATYLWNKDLRTKQTNQILICLCVTLLCLYTTFVIMISLDSTRDYREVQAGPCAFLTALVHFFVLSSIAWMGVEGYNIYLFFVKIFNTYIQNFMIKAFLAAWGIPALIVVLTGAIARDSYAQDDLCFLQFWAQIGGLLIPMSIILLINIVIFILVVRQLLRSANIAGRVKREAKAERRETIERVQNAICILLLLGLTWVTGYLLLIPSFSQVAQPIFIVLNSFQGLFIFLLYCVRNPDIRKKWGLTCLDKFLKKEASTSSSAMNSTAQSSSAGVISNMRPEASGNDLLPTKDDNPDPLCTFNPTFDVSQVEEGVTPPMNKYLQDSTEEQKDLDRDATSIDVGTV